MGARVAVVVVVGVGVVLYFGDPDLVSMFDLAVSMGADPWGFNNCLPLDRELFLDLCFFLPFRFDVCGEEEGDSVAVSSESSFQLLSALDCSKNDASSVFFFWFVFYQCRHWAPLLRRLLCRNNQRNHRQRA